MKIHYPEVTTRLIDRDNEKLIFFQHPILYYKKEYKILKVDLGTL